ncbi:hypothetical protein FB45DRAFT_932527 [Roridomyces roridus]|uniref:Uncharacterized protein n=1 Tax=Roridomyces roridus TaxID=1738132 RepID=A0AAD7BCY2_9AGAR|nr:hypothetical protein FB45DRAFT_932527 [Roridomyces roridus]
MSHGVQKIISTSKDRDDEVRAVSLKVLLKLAQRAAKIPERIKQITPHLLTLLRHQCTRRDAVALLTCLAADKPIRASLLATMRPLLQEQHSTGTVRIISWGHLLLIQSLFEKGKITVEEASDLQFALSLITSKQPAVQDFVLKSMTTTLQRYLARTQTSQVNISIQNLMEGKGSKAKALVKGL